MNEEITITVSLAEAQIIMNGLAASPYREVYQLIPKVQHQIAQQQNKENEGITTT